MRRPAFFPPVTSILLAALVLGALGCAKKGNKLLGSERLLRGGLGTTTSAVYFPDRDTYLTPGDGNFGATLLVGMEGAFESRAFFKPTSWVVPDENDASVVVTSIDFETSYDAGVSIPTGVLLALHRAVDTLTVEPSTPPATFPGPTPGVQFGSRDTDQPAPFRVPISTSFYDSIKTWAKFPTAFRGFVLRWLSGAGVAGLQAGKASVKIGYQHTVSGSVRTDTLTTSIPLDYTLHSTATPLAVGSEPKLLLGGRYEWGVALRFAPPPVEEGSTVNEATLLLRLDPNTPLFPSGVSVDLEVRSLPNAWAESIDDTLSLGAGTTVLASRAAVAPRSAADSVVAIHLPESIIRQWTTAGATNEGVLITAKGAILAPEIHLNSRESASPIILRVTTTTPPPGRF
jgi:hypothetical protein